MSTRSTLRIAGLAAILCGTYIFLVACGADSNANLANTVGIGVVNTNGQPLPPGFSTSPVPVNGPIPGIPDPSNANIQIKPGSSPIPGINPKTANVKPRPDGKTTPGIPSEEELRRQMQRQNPANGASMMRKDSAPPMMRSTNTNGVRTSRKP